MKYTAENITKDITKHAKHIMKYLMNLKSTFRQFKVRTWIEQATDLILGPPSLSKKPIVSQSTKPRYEEIEKLGGFGSWEWASNNKSFSVSRGFLYLLGLPRDTPLSFENYLKLILKEDQSSLREALEQSQFSREGFSLTYRIRHANGSTRWIKADARPIFDSHKKFLKIIGSAQDVTEKVQQDIELTELTLKAEQATQTKAQFLANMSHEIRTPMNGIIGMTNLLLSTALAPEQKDKLQIIQSCSNSLLDLVNDILDFSKIEAGKIELEKIAFSLTAISKEVIEIFKQKALEKNLYLKLEDEALQSDWFIGDPTRIRQILNNLVSNAIKFTSSGGVSLALETLSTSSQTNKIKISVSDTGEGIPPSTQARLFKAFSQADASTTRKFGGTGLGLSISQGLVKQMGGELSVQSSQGKGATFFFEIPLEASVARLVEATQTPFDVADKSWASLYPKTILLAEDNAVNQLVALGYLEKLGYTADVANNGIEVLEKLKHKNYDLIFMDCHMPEMDGYEATRQILASYSHQRPRIVALTASTLKEDIDRCLNVGMDDFIGKPLQINELKKSLAWQKDDFEEEAGERTVVMTKPRSLAENTTNGPPKDFNRFEFLERLDGDTEMMNSLIHVFLKNAPQTLGNLKKAVVKKNNPGVALYAHALKGLAANYCGEKVTKLAHELEQAAKNEQTEVYEQTYLKIEESFNILLDELNELADDVPSRSAIS